MQNGKVTLNSISISYYSRIGSGQPFLYLHGITQYWKAGMPIFKLLPKEFIPYGFDFRGHGQSEWTPGYYSGEVFADDAIKFIETIIKKPTIIYGHSFGGAIAILIASKKPNLVKSLIIGDTPLSIKTYKSVFAPNSATYMFWKQLQKFALEDFTYEELLKTLKNLPVIAPGFVKPLAYKDVPGIKEEFFDMLTKSILQADPSLFTLLLDKKENLYQKVQPQELFKQIKCPVLLLQANPELGAMMSDKDIALALKFLQKGKTQKILQAGHLLHLMKPKIVYEAIKPFIEL